MTSVASNNCSPHQGRTFDNNCSPRSQFESNAAWLEHLRDYLQMEKMQPCFAMALTSSSHFGEVTPLAPRLPQQSWASTCPPQLTVKQGTSDLAIRQTKKGRGVCEDSTWVGEIDSALLPHGTGVMWTSNSDGTVTRRVEKRTHGAVDGAHSWNEVVPPPRNVKQRPGGPDEDEDEDEDEEEEVWARRGRSSAALQLQSVAYCSYSILQYLAEGDKAGRDT